ncbi:hypothetical protein ACFU7T_24080 [Streptomyces sp. NPDC057555]|uniref:hypothetical protein n=1 Tax=Streptomyces sp. NPDC057555 TaxID=3346166 RepID=UPI0036C00EF7
MAILSSVWAIRCWTAESRTEPVVVCHTTVSVSPAAAGMLDVSRSMALLDSLAGSDKLSL